MGGRGFGTSVIVYAECLRERLQRARAQMLGAGYFPLSLVLSRQGIEDV